MSRHDPPADEGAGAEDPDERDRALRRVRWRESEEYKRLTRYLPLSFVLGGTLALGWLAVWFLGDVATGVVSSEPTRTIAGLYAAFFILSIPPYWVLVRGRLARRAFDDRILLGLVSDLQDEEKALAKTDEGKTDLASLWAITQKRIDLYHGIATSQAENSFRVGQIVAVGGFVAVLTLGGIAAFTDSGSGAIAASVIGVAGAAMSGYIGATFMKAQAEASAQLRQFFLQPVEFSRMLGVERLLDDLPPADRAAAVQQIIRSMMPAPQSDGTP